MQNIWAKKIPIISQNIIEPQGATKIKYNEYST